MYTRIILLPAEAHTNGNKTIMEAGMDAQQRLDALDAKMIALFERRMAVVKKQAQELSMQEIKSSAGRRAAEASCKVVRYACDIDDRIHRRVYQSAALCGRTPPKDAYKSKHGRKSADCSFNWR